MKKIPLNLIALMLVGAFGVNSFAGDTKVDGFIDTQLQKTFKGSTTPGFVVEDGALYVAKDMDKAKFMLDIPFKGKLSGSSDFQLATEKAQAWVSYRYNSNWSWKMGQWDSIFRSEAADTWDLPFTQSGIVAGAIDPVNLGLLATYTMNSWDFSLFASNPTNHGTVAAKNFEYGAQWNWMSDPMKLSVGYSFYRENARAFTGRHRNFQLADVVWSTKTGKYNWSAEYLWKNQQVTDATGNMIRRAGWGAVLAATHDWDSEDQCFLRAEYAKKLIKEAAVTTTTATVVGSTVTTTSVAAYDVAKSNMAVTVGHGKMMTKNLKAKIDYTYSAWETSGTPSKKDHEHQINLAALYHF